ncbi:ribosomal RNA-processing protein 8 [Drosophila sechellia]|uniref:Ribosomal RNA-processing protein 8 n=1 Tax=Drosophila sechellia TaxID=7238 RepID=B4HPC6_DROSE|nr:ribosomal RNA-processing protein 8 [Drosophila sechellia]EDW48564.1 GM21938 [Drosophila sechellia]
MKPFEVPPWETGADIIEFEPVNPSGSGVAAKEPKKKKPKKKKPKKKKGAVPEENLNVNTAAGKFSYRQVRGPLDSSDDDDVEDGIRAMHKVMSGRIEKQRPLTQATKGGKKELKLKPELAQAAVKAMEATSSSTPAANSLASKLQSELLGGRFRYINEQLYSTTSRKAEALFRKDSSAFEAYHAGYRQQVEKWPINPLNRIIKTIMKIPKTAIIGDFGCGEGKLAQSVPNKVYSMDLVAARSDIIACNMTDTPLQDRSLDVAVYCLSLMGTDLNEFFLEANRVLKLHGSVYIAEIQSRFEDVREFVRCLNACGFDLIKKDVAVNYFYFFQFKKMRHVPKNTKMKAFSLKPCLYRKR